MYKKIILSLFLIALVFVSSVKVVDHVSTEQLDKAFSRSVTVFAIARGLNGVISVVQGTEVYATPAGVGVNFAVGQIVDPMNDMVERFSWVMLLSSVSLGVQEIMMKLGQTGPVQLLLAISAVFLIAMLWIPKLWHAHSFNFIFKSFVIFSFLRFAVPLIILFTEGIYTYALEPKYEEAKTALIFSNQEIKGIISDVQNNQRRQIKVHEYHERTLIQKAQKYFDDTIESLDLKKQLESLQKRFEHLLDTLERKFNHAIDYILTLITVFIVQSVLLPLFLLWAFLKLFREFIGTDFAKILVQHKIR
jgi:hypothetical protein